MKHTICTVFLVHLCFNGFAYGHCSGKFNSAMSFETAAYDPFSVTDTRKRQRLTLRNLSDRPCYFRVYFIGRKKMDAFGSEIKYNLNSIAGTDILRSTLIEEEAQGVDAGPIDGSNSVTIEFDLTVDRGQFAHPGTYFDTIDAVLQGAETPSSFKPATTVELDREPLVLSVNVKSVGSLSVSGAGLFTTVQFEQLQNGKKRSLILEARSNAAYDLTFHSANGGQMSLDPPIADRDWNVLYEVKVDGARVDVNEPVLLSNERSEFGTRNHLLDFVIIDAMNKRAGIYKDVITGTITPKY